LPNISIFPHPALSHDRLTIAMQRISEWVLCISVQPPSKSLRQGLPRLGRLLYSLLLSSFQPESFFERGNGREGRGGLICYTYEIRGEIPHKPPKNARWSHLRSCVAVRLALL
jgi:hypothetical protein